MNAGRVAMGLLAFPLMIAAQDTEPGTFSRPWQLSPWVGLGFGLGFAGAQFDSGGTHTAAPFMGSASAGFYLGHGLSAGVEGGGVGIGRQSTTVRTVHVTTFGDLAGWSAGLKIGAGRGWLGRDGDRLVDQGVVTVAVLFWPQLSTVHPNGVHRATYGTTADMFFEDIRGRKGRGIPPDNARYQFEEFRFGFLFRLAWFDLNPPR